MSVSRLDRALWVLIVGFVVLVAAVSGSAWVALEQQRTSALVSHTLVVQRELRTVLSRLEDAETGQRGYLLTGREDYLEPYNSAALHLRDDVSAVAQLVADNPIQSAAVVRLRKDAEERQALLVANVARHRLGETIPVATLDLGKSLMDDLRRTIAEMDAREARLLTDRTASAARQSEWTMGLLLSSAAVALLLGLFSLTDGRRRVSEAIAAKAALDATQLELRREAESREVAEAQVRQMQKMEAIGQLTGGIAHDFNNMLAIVLGSLDLAKRRLRTAPDRAEACIDNAMEGTHRAAQLTARLLAFSRQQPLAPRSLDVNKLVGGMSEMLRRTIGEDLRVETVLAGGLWRAFADPGELENAIINLAVNARDAMPDGGHLTVETVNAHLDDEYASAYADVRAGQYVMVSVTDTGGGMPPEVVSRAFDPFYTTKGVGKGTGLGLSQVHGFVKQSGGHVKIYSEPGVGTSVKIYLPRAAASESLEPVRLAHAETPRSANDEVVLVVEDDERVRHVSVDALRELGYTVLHAPDAGQALSVLAEQPRIDLLFTDIVMPDLNGRVLAEEARKSRPDLKVLFTTGYTRNAIVHNGMLDVDVAFLPKPFTVEQLAVKVRQVLDGVGANRPG